MAYTVASVGRYFRTGIGPRGAWVVATMIRVSSKTVATESIPSNRQNSRTALSRSPYQREAAPPGPVGGRETMKFVDSEAKYDALVALSREIAG